jgi:hypothetical protein
MSMFSSLKKEDELFLVFDLGSASVRGAIFTIDSNKVPHILFSVSEPIKLKDELNFDEFFKATISALDIVSGKIFFKKLGAPKKIFAILSSAWFVSEIRNISYESDKNFVFDQKFADSLIKTEIEKFEKEYGDKDSEFKEMTPIELRTTKILLNGYNVPAPMNQKTQKAEMSIFVSLSSKVFVKKVEETINKHFSIAEIKFSSFVMASFAVVRNLFISQENFILIDISGEITDISMVKKDILNSSISFPFGVNYILRNIAKNFNCSIYHAKSMFALYKENHADEETMKRMDFIIKTLAKDWLRRFQESLTNFSNDISIPSTIFLTVENDFADFFSETIKSDQFHQYTLADSKFKIIYMGTQALHGIAIYENSEKRDPFITIDCIYISNFLR